MMGKDPPLFAVQENGEVALAHTLANYLGCEPVGLVEASPEPIDHGLNLGKWNERPPLVTWQQANAAVAVLLAHKGDIDRLSGKAMKIREWLEQDALAKVRAL